MRWKPLVGVAALLLAACGQQAVAPAADATAAAPPNSSPAIAAPVAGLAPSAAAGPSFNIAITVSPTAQAQMASARQDIIISADFYGMANAQGHSQADDMGQIALANELRVSMPSAGGQMTIQVPALDQSKLPLIQGDPQMLINVFSGEDMNPDNKLDCGLFEDRLALAEQAGVQITCKLIGGN